MLLFSMLSPATFTLINEASENHNRSAMQSLTSLTFTLGAGTTALGLSWILRSSSLYALWIGIALFGITLTLGKNLYIRRYAEPETRGD
jgi:apolipoprotein N-acyltransferase